MGWLSAALVSAVLYGLWGFLSKISSIQLGAKSALLYQALGGLLVAIIIAGKKHWSIESDYLGAANAFFVGVVGMVATLFFLKALTTGSVSIINTIISLSPVVTIILAVLILRESISMTQGLGVVLALVSIYLMVDGGHHA